MIILGIETSCDETGISLVENGQKVLISVVNSSLKLHAKTGGIIPETAAREQLKSFLPALEIAFDEAGIKPQEIDAIAVTQGPGLFGSLIIGVEAAKTLAFAWKKPFIPVNHLIGHVYANWLENPEPPQFPNLNLIVSGGHSELVLMGGHGEFKWLGGTRDDAAGEAFDKTARLLKLGYPGGPAIEKTSQGIKTNKKLFPRPLEESNDFDFSFSGLKTAVATYFEKGLGEEKTSTLAFEIQEAIVDSLLKKTLKAAKKFKVKEILLGGGVAANKRLVEKTRESFPGKVQAPAVKYCVDNGAMIASAAFFNFKPESFEKIEADSGLFFS